MRNQDAEGLTRLLAAWKGGDRSALGRLVEIVYPTLRQIAHRHLAHRRAGESLESAALANEAYLKLERAGGIGCRDRSHFLALCSQVMRRILVDHARRRLSARRGGDALCVALDDALLAARAQGIEILALHGALDALAKIDGRKSVVVELRYFGGLSLDEAAEVLGVSVETVKRDWRLARAWLLAELADENPRPVAGEAASRLPARAGLVALPGPRGRRGEGASPPRGRPSRSRAAASARSDADSG